MTLFIISITKRLNIKEKHHSFASAETVNGTILNQNALSTEPYIGRGSKRTWQILI